MRGLTLVKLGGSLLTDKRQIESARLDVIERLAAEVAARPRGGDAPGLIIGHGSGSFGHVAAANVGMAGATASGGSRAASALDAASVHHAAMTLHRMVVGALTAAGAAPFSLPPSAWMVAEDGAPAAVFVEPIRRALDLGSVPVVCGDVVLDRHLGATICSTETVFDSLIGALMDANRVVSDDGRRVDRLLWLGETAGIYDQDGATIARVDVADSAAYAAVRNTIGDTAGTDVTGGMLLRLETACSLAEKGIDSWIVDGTVPGLLAAALAGDTVPGTHVAASNAADSSHHLAERRDTTKS